MIPAAKKDAELLAEIQQSNQPDDDFRLWWLGQSGFLIQFRQRHLLLDPYLSDSLTAKYASTDKPHIRMTELAIQPRQLDFIDVVTSSHQHTDHLDHETLLPLLEVNRHLAVIVPRANLDFAAQRLRVPPERLTAIDAGESCEVAGFRLHGVPAAHEQLERDEQGRYCYLGYVVQFGPWTVYHSGDTVRYPEMDEWLSKWSLDVALLPINGRSPERRVAGNFWGHEAARLARDLHALSMVIPCHFDMFTFNTASPDEFVRTCRQLNQPHRVLRCGERWSSRELPRQAEGE